LGGIRVKIMEQLLRIKELRIRNFFLLLSLKERKQIKAKSLLYLLVFLVLFIGMVILDPNPNRIDASNSSNESAAKFLKFVAGNFLIASLYLGHKMYRASKEIRGLEKDYAEMEWKLRYLSNRGKK